MFRPEQLASWCRTGLIIIGKCVQGVPHGARLVGQGYDIQRDLFMLKFDYDDFDEVEEGEIIPTEEVIFGTLDEQDLDIIQREIKK